MDAHFSLLLVDHHLSLQAIKILNMIKVFGKPIRVNKASTDKTSKDVGANLFIGNLDPDVDEKVSWCLHQQTEGGAAWVSREICEML